MTKRPLKLTLLTLLLLLIPLLTWSGQRCLSAEPANPDAAVDAPLPPEEAASSMVVPEGFHVTLFAGEPDVKQPIGFCLDDRGRLWVAEAYNYPNHGDKPGDRIIILEDIDGDGKFDKRSVFYDGLNYVTGIEVGFGGAWVMSPPYFYFIPDRNGDDRPDGPPEVLLDGFGNHSNSHNLANGFAWGPDGWLYGTHGRTNWSLIGKPGTPNKERIRFDGGVYRYHPVRHEWEPFADGTTNPWGIDWDDYGQAFVCNCVNPHLFHVIQGAHYEPWRDRDSSRHAYQRIDTIADHLHYTGGGDVRAGIGSGEEIAAGGGHAHCGTMVYLGDSWPDKYRNTVFMNNIHGRRINNDILKREGSGYVASHGADFLLSKDPWYMGVTLQYGPDGAAYASDWSDTGECHSVKNTRRETGRIFKIQFGKQKAPRVDLAKLTNDELVQLQTHRNDWFVRHARRLLQERAAAGQDMAEVRKQLHAMYTQEADVPRKLRALWALHVVGGLNENSLFLELADGNEYIRAWAVRLLTEEASLSDKTVDWFRAMALLDDSPFVRLHLASAMQRIDPKRLRLMASCLAGREEDAADQTLTLMIWYAIEPLVHENLYEFVRLGREHRLPLLSRFIARRIASLPDPETGLEELAVLIADPDYRRSQAELLTGMLEGLAGRRSVKMPDSWPQAYQTVLQSKDNESTRVAMQLALLFDDSAALVEMRAQAADKEATPENRQWIISALVAKKPKDLPPLLLELLNDPATSGAAVRGLAEFDEPQTAEMLLSKYADFDPATRSDVIQTLSSRPKWALALMQAVEEKKIPRSDINAFAARQMTSLGDAELTARVNKLWGEVRTTPAEKAKLIAQYKRRFTFEALARADRSAGRAVYQKTCANCHRLFDEGGKIGPDITGAQRSNLDYLLENLLDPSAAVAKDYQMQKLVTEGGRVITGLVVDETETAITIQTATEKIIVPLAEIESRAESEVSMMPDGQLQQLSPTQLLDLIAYLQGQTQVPAKGK